MYAIQQIQWEPLDGQATQGLRSNGHCQKEGEEVCDNLQQGWQCLLWVAANLQGDAGLC